MARQQGNPFPPNHDTEMALAWEKADENSLPKGLVRRLLAENEVSPEIIDQVTSSLIPYAPQ